MTQFTKLENGSVEIKDIDLVVHAMPEEIIEAARSLQPVKTEAQALADLED